MKKIKVGIIGCGTIGSALAHTIQKKFSPTIRVAFLADSNVLQARSLQKKLSSGVKIAPTKAVIQHSDFVIEAASIKVSFDIAYSCLKLNKDVLIMSIGGLVKKVHQLRLLGKKSKGTLYLPSGAICGIDGILAAQCGGITKATLTTRKPLKGLRGAPYFALKKINIDAIKKETVVFSGSAEEAIRYFPKNVNVAALLSLASLGSKKTKVQIITSPSFTCNSHDICVEGASGKITTKTENVPSPTNPKTSYLAILAAEALLKKKFSSLKIGT
ncbi:MAG: DUF108 domain-containing protein [Candidatus Omnitrophica bacterium]|nr:DUF108 domain-containing protein [Candidatus Omnitrophota bacterium]